MTATNKIYLISAVHIVGGKPAAWSDKSTTAENLPNDSRSHQSAAACGVLLRK